MTLWNGSSGRRESATEFGCRLGDHDVAEANMQTVVTVGLDIAKSVFQVHGVDAEGEVVLRRQPKRARGSRFSRSYCLVSSAWMPVPHHIIGRAS
jgi:hypothetical protein